MSIRRQILYATFCMVFVICGGIRSANAEITDRHREVVNQVFTRLLAVMETPDGWESWPPTITVIDPGIANAYASFHTVDGVDVPYVEVTVTTIEKIANFDPDVLAFTIGHELGHLYYLHGHKRLKHYKEFGDKLTGIRLAFTREQELEADQFGMELSFKAGYSRQGLLKDLKAWRNSSAPYCQFEGLSVGHPSWEDRAAYLLDTPQQRALWRSLSSFQTGVMFLENQHYAHAESCFRNVTEEFPECYEGWANLGYALLMQYCDALDEEDLRLLDIGHLVVGGFYRRPDSLEPPIRGTIEKLWFEAVGALREALRMGERLN
ncbi:MAG TPA: M48 family metalloprotease, partial [Planctomicrobium sp.]|nr:M48 family metalloprotease [Planctomicrobium sp.]